MSNTQFGGTSKILNNFIKNDSGKPRVSLIDPNFTLGVAKVLTEGAEKYGTDNWKSCEDPARFRDALYRHLLAYLSGETIDPLSNKPHMHHIGCNAMFLAYLDSNETV